MQNNQRPGVSWNNLDVYEWGTQAGESGRAYVPNACVQCEKPACVDACPTGASVRRDDGITVIDFKTDRVSPEQTEARAQNYRGQLETYRDALARIFGKPVKQTVLYFLKPGKEVVL